MDYIFKDIQVEEKDLESKREYMLRIIDNCGRDTEKSMKTISINPQHIFDTKQRLKQMDRSQTYYENLPIIKINNEEHHIKKDNENGLSNDETNKQIRIGKHDEKIYNQTDSPRDNEFKNSPDIFNNKNSKICRQYEGSLSCKKNREQKMTSKFKNLTSQLQSLNQRLQETILKKLQNDQYIQNLDLQIKNLNEKLMDGKGTEFMKKYFTGIAFVCFKSEQDKEDIIDKYRQIGYEDRLISKEKLESHSLIFHNQKLQIQQAPDPTDVNWLNLHFTNKDKIIRRVLAFLFTTASLFMCAVANYYFHSFQISEINDAGTKNSLKIQIISSSLAVFISILNALLSVILRVSSEYCKYSTLTDTNIFIAKGLSVAMFVNSALISFVIQVIVPNKQKQDTLFGGGGLADNANYFMISNCFVTALASIINVEYYILVIMRKIERNKGADSVLTQSELNELYQNPQFPIEERYAQLLMTMFTTAFYCPIVPMTIVWSIIGIFLQYWIDKYNLIHRSSVSHNMSATLCIEMTEHLEYFLPIQSISTLIFYQYANGGSWGISSIIGTALGLIHAFLPMQLINERFFSVEKSAANIIQYEEAQNLFITDYCRENPIYKKQARESHVMKMSERIISQKLILKSVNPKLGQSEPNIFIRNLDEKKVPANLFTLNLVNTNQTPPTLSNNIEAPTNSFDKNCNRRMYLANGSSCFTYKEIDTICLQKAKTQETFQTNDEERSLKPIPTQGGGQHLNLRKQAFLSSKLVTNETNLGLIEEEIHQANSQVPDSQQSSANNNQNTQSKDDQITLSNGQSSVCTKINTTIRSKLQFKYLENKDFVEKIDEQPISAFQEINN